MTKGDIRPSTSDNPDREGNKGKKKPSAIPPWLITGPELAAPMLTHDTSPEPTLRTRNQDPRQEVRHPVFPDIPGDQTFEAIQEAKQREARRIQAWKNGHNMGDGYVELKVGDRKDYNVSLRAIFDQGEFSRDTGFRGFEGKVVADVGSNDGRYVQTLRDCGAEAVYGIDPDHVELGKAVKDGILDEEHALAVRLQDLPDHLKGTFDTAVVFNPFWEVAENKGFLQSLRDAIRPDGEVLMAFADSDVVEKVLPAIQEYFHTEIRQWWKTAPGSGEDIHFDHSYAIVAHPKEMSEEA